MSRSFSFANTNTTPSADSNNNVASQTSPSQSSQPRQATGRPLTPFLGGYSSEPMMTYDTPSQTPPRTRHDDSDRSFVSLYDLHLIRAVHARRLGMMRTQQWESNPCVRFAGGSPASSGSSTPAVTTDSSASSSTGLRVFTGTAGSVPRVLRVANGPISPMSPAPALPVVNGSDTGMIEPYGLPPNIGNDSVVRNVPLDSVYYPVSCHVLANCGWNCMIDYPVSTSPRKSAASIRSSLRRFDSSFQDSKVVGQTLHIEELDKVDTLSCFTPFSYTNSSQPRTEAMREMEGESMSPRSRG
jgi:hypothetical protein